MQERGIDGSGVTVAMVDSGIDPAALGKPIVAAYDAIGNGQMDQHGHGTLLGRSN